MGDEGRGTRHDQKFAYELPRKIQVSQQVLEWQAEAAMECSRRCILRAIELRLRAPVPDDLTAGVKALTDNELWQWLDAVLISDSLESFRAAIGQSPRIS